MHPLFWAVDINNELSDNAAISSFFDILMEGSLDQETGDYNVEVVKNDDDPLIKQTLDANKGSSNNLLIKEPRAFMYCQFLHHPGLSTI